VLEGGVSYGVLSMMDSYLFSSASSTPSRRYRPCDQRFSDVIREPQPACFSARARTQQPKGRLILLHGVGSNEANPAPLADALPEALEVLLPRGPLQIGPRGSPGIR
jgi:hypothetical protein